MVFDFSMIINVYIRFGFYRKAVVCQGIKETKLQLLQQLLLLLLLLLQLQLQLLLH